ncbi:MAG: polysaccharide deacetylase family protein [Candidatus Helarchaeota archaeon]
MNENQIRIVSNFLKKINLPCRNNQNISAILTYHGVSLKPTKNCVTIELFKQHLDFLKSNYKLIKLRELIRKINNGEIFKENYVSITFDDAYQNFYEYAYPELIKRKIPATVFIPAKLIGYYNWWDYDQNSSFSYLKIMELDQLKQLDADLIDLGSHSATHLRLSLLNDEKLVEEIKGSKKILKEALHVDIDLFAYPYGGLSDFDNRVFDILMQGGYIAALTTHFGRFNTDCNLYMLRRISVWDEDTVKDLETKLKGYYDWLAYKEKFAFFIKRRIKRFLKI